jgi:ATP-binding cassette subfamily B protein
MSYIGYIYGPLRWMTSLPRSIANAVTSMAKLNEIIEEEPDIRDKADAITPEIEGNISFVNATFGYKSYEPVLKNITLDIKKGEMVGIVGHSGVGKSTMINLIMRLYDLNSGKLLIDGVDIKDISKETLCKSIGTVFQETFLFAGSIYDNIVYAKPEATPEEVFAAAKIANAHEFIIKLPDAYNTVVGENGYSLSGGERQRVAIARAILRDPKILILDEATASLDTETESKIQEALQRLIKGRTTIAIAHRLSTLRHADRLIVLEKGKLAEQGSHEELLKNKGIYYNLVMAQRQTTKMADVKK